MGKFDVEEVERMEKNIAKKLKENSSSLDNNDNIAPQEVQVEEGSVEDDWEDIDGNEDDPDAEESFTNQNFEKKKMCTQNRVKLRNSAKECMRWGLSARGGAAIINAALADYGIIAIDKMSQAVDKSKLRRAIKSYAKEVKAEQIAELKKRKPGGCWFDGKKDETLHTITDDQGRKKNIVFKEEHVSVICQPGGDYVTHLTPPGGKGVEIATDLAKFLKDHNLADTTLVVGCDSTAVNTGNQNGVLTFLERIFKRRVLWQICQLQLNEWPLRHAFVKIDGETDSKNTFKGVIGKMLPNVEDMELKITFLAIKIGDAVQELPEAVIKDLSSDQHMLYLAWISVRTGKLRAELLSLTPGPVSHSRWLTLALRILLLYMTDNKLKGKNKRNLQVLVSFLVTNYIPMWFTIKKLGKAEQSSQVLFKQIQLANQLKGPIAAIVKQNVARNAYAAQSETLLLCMLCDADPIPRTVAVDKIL